MKFALTLSRQGQVLGQQIVEIADAESFAAACRNIWADCEKRALEQETSIGALMEYVNEEACLQLDGAELSFRKT